MPPLGDWSIELWDHLHLQLLSHIVIHVTLWQHNRNVHMMMYLFNKYIVFRGGGQKPCNVCKIDISSTIFNQCQWKKAEKIDTKKEYQYHSDRSDSRQKHVAVLAVLGWRLLNSVLYVSYSCILRLISIILTQVIQSRSCSTSW